MYDPILSQGQNTYYFKLVYFLVISRFLYQQMEVVYVWGWELKHSQSNQPYKKNKNKKV